MGVAHSPVNGRKPERETPRGRDVLLDAVRATADGHRTTPSQDPRDRDDHTGRAQPADSRMRTPRE